METSVIIHFGVVAVQVSPVDPTSDKQSLWPMIIFGFGTIAILTQVINWSSLDVCKPMRWVAIRAKTSIGCKNISKHV